MDRTGAGLGRTKRLMTVCALAGTVGLSGCNPFAPPSLDASGIEPFFESYMEMHEDVAAKNPDQAHRLEESLLKLSAFAAPDQEGFNVAAGLKNLDLSAVLPDNPNGLRRTIFASTASLVDGMTADEVIALANRRQTDVAQKYKVQIDAAIADNAEQIEKMKNRQGKISSVLSEIVLYQSTYGRRTASDAVGSFTSVVMNGGRAEVAGLTLQLTADDPPVQENISIDFTADPILPDEQRQIDAPVQAESASIIPAVPVAARVVGVTYASGVSLSLDPVVEALDLLERKADALKSMRSNIGMAVAKPFEGFAARVEF